MHKVVSNVMHVAKQPVPLGIAAPGQKLRTGPSPTRTLNSANIAYCLLCHEIAESNALARPERHCSIRCNASAVKGQQYIIWAQNLHTVRAIDTV
jgi:hypothetical protein